MLMKRNCMDKSLINKYSEEYFNILERVYNGDKFVNESTMQNFLEQHTAFIPTPFLLNHGIHFDAFISKLPIGPRYCDLAYLTKSSDEWWIVLMELENPHKKLFKGGLDYAKFSADYTQALQQIKDWKTFIVDYRKEVINTVQRMLQPLSKNKVSFKYVLVMGSRKETATSKARSRALAEENSGNFKILTYETILSDYIRNSEKMILTEKLILTPYDFDRFKIKYIPVGNKAFKFNTMIFSYLSPEDINLTDEQISLFKDDGYDMDSWLKGNLLTVNNKFVDSNEIITSLMNRLANK